MSAWIRKVAIFGALHIAVILGLSALPLVGTAGYENSLVLAPIFSALAMVLGVFAARCEQPRDFTQRICLALASLWCVLGVAALALAVVGAWNPSCDLLTGFGFFAMGPLLSAHCGLLSGLWGGYLVRRFALQILVGAMPMLGSTLLGLWWLYSEPVVFAYDPFWGYVSGAIYDEHVVITPTYLAYRAYNGLAWLAACLGLGLFASDRTAQLEFRGLRERIARLPSIICVGLAVGLVGLCIVIFCNRAALRFTNDDDALTRELEETYTTEHFVVHVSPGALHASEVAALLTEHEFAWKRLTELMGRSPATPVHSFIFASPEQKRELVGAGYVEVAAPWRKHIYLNNQGFPHGSLHHELAHVFAGEFGDPLFGLSRRGARLNMALVEGFATALSPRSVERLDLHDQAAVLDILDKRPPLAKILGPQFWLQGAVHSYTTVGSFCLWLIETHGMHNMLKLYESAGDFEEAYGATVQELEAKWLAFLHERKVSDEDVEIHRQRFALPGLFARPCAHKAAKILAEIEEYKQRGHLRKIAAMLRELCSLEPERPEHLLSLAQVLRETGESVEAMEVLDALLAKDALTAAIKSGALELRGDLDLALNRWESARAAYAQALQNPTGESQRRVLELKHHATFDPLAAPWFTLYFGYEPGGSLGLPQAQQTITKTYAAARLEQSHSNTHISAYLLARLLTNAKQFDLARAEYYRALNAKKHYSDWPSERFVRAARWELLRLSVLRGLWSEARGLLAVIESEFELKSGEREDLKLWRERVEFFSAFTGVPEQLPPP